jgi:hypothetical protein
MPKQISLPANIYTIYDFFDKTKNPDWKENPFTSYKKINNLEIKIAKNISNLNFYQVDFQINKKIKPEFLIKYIKNIDYRNYYSKDTLFYKFVSSIDENNWIENEFYNGSKNKFIVTDSNFIVLFYNETPSFGQDLSDTKYYHAYKILNNNDNNILRFEIVLNNMDMDQDIDIIIYMNMIIRLLKAVHDKFKQTFPYELIKKPADDECYESDVSNILSSAINSQNESESGNSKNSRNSTSLSKEDKNTQTPLSSVCNNDEKELFCNTVFTDKSFGTKGIAYYNANNSDENLKTITVKLRKPDKN